MTLSKRLFRRPTIKLRAQQLEDRVTPAAVPFGLPHTVLSGVGYPYTTIAADLNGDSRPDILATATDGSAIFWTANLGNGIFGPKQTVDAGKATEFVANTYAVDFNGDGSLDVLSAGDDVLRVYLNNGNGTFAEPLTVAPTGSFRTALAADLDGDGDKDIATILNSEGEARWYRNNGNGTFTLAQTFGTGLAGARAMTVGDFNGDGSTDVVVGANGVNKIVQFRNDGAGNFAAEELVTTDIAGIRNLYTSDLNADGHSDLVSVAYGSSEVAWFENDGTGAFTKHVISNVPVGFFAAAVGDIDGNGTPDLATASFDESSVSWFSNDGAGNFGPRRVISSVPGGGGLLSIGLGDFNADGHVDVVAGDTTDPYKVAVYENRTGRFSTVVIPPANGTALIGQSIDVSIHFGVPVTVTGAPEIDLQVGDTTRTAVYVAGSGTPRLTFRYVVTAADVDASGIELTSATVRLAGGTLLDPDGAAVNLNLPAADLSGVKVNGSAPLVASVVRLDPGVTNATTVRLAVTFSEPVTGVDAADFAPRGESAGSAVTGVSGTGTTYTVTLSTGTGSGSLGLSVLNDGTIIDAAANALGVGFSGGEVYTLQRRPARTIDTFFSDSHGDIGIGFEDGSLHPHVHTDALGEMEADEVVIYGGPDALRTTPTGPQWAFLGAGSQSYWFPETGAIATVPDLGVGAEEIPAGTLASYLNTDPRVNATGAWVTVRLVGYRGPAGGHFSVYNSGSPDPTVWMATSNGIDSKDVLFAPQGSHNHYNFAFSAAGNYQVDVVASGYRDANGNGTYDPGIDPYTESGVTTYYFQIDTPGGPQPLSLPADPLPPAPPPVVVPFGLPTTIGTPGQGSSVTAADIDNDGDPDLLVGVYGSNTVAWVENLGGAFGPIQTITTTADGVWFTRPGDLDNDGDLDAIVGMYSGTLAWYEFDGGAFGPAKVLATDVVVPFVESADMDGDGLRDVLAAPDVGSEVYWFKNLGGGAFGPQQTALGGFTAVSGFLPTDLDGDGDTDLVVADYGAGKILWYHNDGTGAFGPSQEVATDDRPVLWSSGDFNGDGRQDLLVRQRGSSSVSWYPVLADGTIGARQNIPITIRPFALTAADFDGDGDQDVAAAAFGGSPDTVWTENLGGGVFGPERIITQSGGQVSMLATGDFDGDGDDDLIINSYSLGKVLHVESRVGEFATEIVPPAAGSYLAGYQLDVTVHYGFPVAVTGTPVLDLDVGGNTVVAEYVSGSGTPALTFRYVVQPTDRDLDGVALAGPAVRLDGGTLTDPVGNPVNLSLPGADLSAVEVNGSAPFVTNVTRLGPTPTSVGSVQFQVTFNEAVTGVDPADFGLAEAGIDSAAVTAVSGSGATYTVTVSTGTGSGSLGLNVLETASISDTAGNALGAGFSGGEVFTLNRRPERTIDTFYTQGHGDIGVGFEDGALHPHVHTDDLGELEADEVLIYGGPDALRTTPTGPEWAFLGAGAESYWFPATGDIATVPDLGVSGEEIPPGTFASYLPTDPRVTDAGPWVTMHLVGFRGPDGGQFSVYSSGDTGPKVWMATSDGIDDTDKLFIFAGSHAHYNFAFSAAGNYQVDVVASGYRDANGNGTYDPGIDPYTESGVTTYYFQIDQPGGPTPLSLPADAPPAVHLMAFGAGVGGGPRVQVRDMDGTVRHDFFAYDPSFRGGVTVATGDLNGDGVDDVVTGVGPGGGPHVQAFDGVTGAQLANFFAYDDTLRGGVNIAVHDLDGDGKAEIVTGAGIGGGPHVKVFNASGVEQRGWFAFDPEFRGGVTVAVGDTNGDGVVEVIAAPGSDHAPEVRVFNATTGAPTKSFAAYATTATGGIYLASGDLNGDGVDEIITGAGPGVAGGHVKVFDGVSGQVLTERFAFGSDFTGGVRVAINGSGELLAAPGTGMAGTIRRFHGIPLSDLETMMSFEESFTGGVFVG